MRHLLTSLLIVLMMAATASAYSIAGDPDDIYVGDADYLYAWTNTLGDSGYDTEKAWVAGELGLSVDDLAYLKTDWEPDGSYFWDPAVEGGNVYAYNVPDEPEYYLIKTGSIGTPDYRHFLFENVSLMDWAVVDLDDMGAVFETYAINIGKFSHIGETAPVPEPSTFLLLGGGLVGLAFYGRKRSKK